MSIRIAPIRLAGLLLASLVLIFYVSPASAQTGSPPAPPATRIVQVAVSRAGQETSVRIEGDSRLSYQASRLNNPERLVLDFSGVQLAVSKTSIPSDVKLVRRVRVSQFKPDVARVVIDLEQAVPYSVKAEGQSVTVAFAESAPLPQASNTPAAPPSESVATVPTPANDPPRAASASPAPPAAGVAPAQNDASSPPAQQAKYSGEPVLGSLKDASPKAQGPAQGSTSGPSASASTTTEASTTADASTLQSIASDDYLINPEDVLDVHVYDVPELSHDYVVSAAGTVTVPLLPKPVQAAGLSPDQFAHGLEESFRRSGRLSRPQITVAIRQSRRSLVNVEGAVKTPQAVPVIARTKLLYVLSQCGGLADDHGITVTVSRGPLARRDLALEGGPVTPTLNVELKKLMDPNDPTSLTDVWPGDQVSVERAGIFYVLGQLNRPGGYNLRTAQEEVTILEALAIAGDLTPVAKKSKAVIIRKDTTAPSGRKEIALNLTDILAGRSQDQVLQDHDILYVPASGGKRAMRTLVGVPASVVTGAAGAATYSRY
jgi:polysaccharide export outer membrane protein